MKKQLTLIVVPHDNSKMRNYRISYNLLYTFVSLAAVSLVIFTIFVGTYGRTLMKAHQAQRLEKERKRLIEKAAQIDSLGAELLRLQALGIQVKKMLGVGISVQDSILVANLSPIAKSPVIGDEGDEYEVVREEQQLLLRAIPSLWPIKGYVTREFHTTGGEKSAQYHPGIDIAAMRNTPIRASAEGIIVTSGWDDTYGYMVVIDHGFGIYSLYGHNARNLLKVGDRVSRGQTIAFLGSTGSSTAPHLHFEIKKNGVPVNPRDYLLN